MLNRLSPTKLGSSVLVFGSGPAGILLAQLLRENGGCHVVIASLPGAKLDMAIALGAADEFVVLSGGAAAAAAVTAKDDDDEEDAALAGLKQKYTHGFDIVVEATGVAAVLENSINFVRKGGQLAVFGVCSSKARVTWNPSMILGNQISIVGSVAEMVSFPATVQYLESKRVRVDGIVNRTFKLEEWGDCLRSLRDEGTVKAAVAFD